MLTLGVRGVMKAGLWVSSDEPGSEYAVRARRVAEGAARRAAAPLLAVRQQRQDLESARAELQEGRRALEAAQAEIARLREELSATRRNADPRRAPAAVERVIEQHALGQDDIPAPALRDLALAVADLDVNGVPGVVVVVAADAAAHAVIAASGSPVRVVMTFDQAAPADLDDPVALAYLGGSSYDTTLTCLQLVAPLLVSGGRIVANGYADSSEVQKATDEYFRDRRMDFRREQHSRLHVVRR